MVITTKVTVGTAASLLGTGIAGPPPNSGLGMTRLTIINLVANPDIYVGGANVSTTNGVPVKAERSISFARLGPLDSVYARVATGTADVIVLVQE